MTSKLKTAAAWGLALASVAVTIPLRAEAKQNSRTLHVEVKEKGGDHVSIAVPVGLAKAALRIAGKVNVDLEDDDVRVPEMREAWRELRDSGESAIIDVKDGKDTVHITNKRGMVTVNVDGDGERVRIAVPETAVDALLSGEGNALDLGAALDVLDGQTGDIVDIVDGDDQVRIWID
jgi:hypothetical protein